MAVRNGRRIVRHECKGGQQIVVNKQLNVRESSLAMQLDVQKRSPVVTNDRASNTTANVIHNIRPQTASARRQDEVISRQRTNVRPQSSTSRNRKQIPSPKLLESRKRISKKKKCSEVRDRREDSSSNDLEGISGSSPSKSPRLDNTPHTAFLQSILQAKDQDIIGVSDAKSSKEEFQTSTHTLHDTPSINDTFTDGGCITTLHENNASRLMEATSNVHPSYSVCDDGVEEIPWSVTELKSGTGDKEEDVDDGLEQSQTRRSFLALSIKYEEKSDEKTDLDEDSEDPSRKFREERQKQLREAAKSLMEGADVYKDEDYDTDLEEDFPKEPEPRLDEAGVSVYIQECKMEGVDPSPYVKNHLKGTTFVMRHRYLGMRAFLPFARAMQKNTTVEFLNLSDNRIDSLGSSAVAEMMRDNCYVTRLDMSHNLMGSPGTSAFASMLETNYTLKRLCLKANHLTDKDAQLLAEGLKNNVTLTDLDLSSNDFGEAAGIHLGKGLASNDGLVYLDLGWNAIRAKGVLELANALKVNSSLEVLDLSRNGINLPGCQAMLRALKLNQGLKVLDLSHNHITSEGARKISLGLKKNSSLEGLLLSGNRIGDVGILALLKAIGTGKTGIRLLGLQDIPMPEAVHNKCTEIQAKFDVCILRLDVDGRRKFMPPSHVTAMVDQFIAENAARFLSSLLHLDEQKKRALSSDDIINILSQLGIDMNQDELESALHHVGALDEENISYLQLLDGLAVLQGKAMR
ncbi:uncharacterized protein [Apostichopus japonicus]|uniref:uncharacterized protein isoform X2 n=1 Tax=Stichopus japonicus TaxID=307972 RepID=UPI003AB22A06